MKRKFLGRLLLALLVVLTVAGDVYAKAEELPRVLNGLGTAIISTSKGIMSDKDARAQKMGGEVVAYIW